MIANVYRAYSVVIASDTPLPSEPCLGARADLEVIRSAAPLATRSAHGPESEPRLHRACEPDGSDYVWWPGLFEARIAADGRRVFWRTLPEVPTSVFDGFLAGQVVSFALLRLGIEALHATTVVVGDEAIGLLGDPGQGKSTLGAAFLADGHRLLADDLLVIREAPGGPAAWPGLPRIKLFPDAARAALPGALGAPLHPMTGKFAARLSPDRCHDAPAPLRALYVLETSAVSRPAIRRLEPPETYWQLLRHTFNTLVDDPWRLRQQFAWTGWLADTVPVYRLTFPRRLECLADARNALVEAHASAGLAG